jgi:chromosome segregation ATPase
MSNEFQSLQLSVEHLLAEHTRLSVENQALVQRSRELEEKLAANSLRVRQAQMRLNALMAQLPLDIHASDSAAPASVAQHSLI